MITRTTVDTSYLECVVKAVDAATGLPADLSGDLVEYAFPAVGAKPVVGDWRAAVWTGPDLAGLLLGPTGGTVLAVGSYDWWVRVTDSPEVPARKVDEVRII